MEEDILIIGAGMCGLMTARELGNAGKKVIILEARSRIGGRVWPLPIDEFGFQNQAGAEFVHGGAPVTQALIEEAGLTFVPTEGEIWSVRDGDLTKEEQFMPHQDLLNEKLKELQEDLPIADFLTKYFGEEKYAILRNSVTGMVEGYDAADTHRISTFTLRDEWLGGEEWKQGKIKEGYGALINFFESECKKNGVQVLLNKQVASINAKEGKVVVETKGGEKYNASRVVVTVALPTIQNIDFIPPLPKKIKAASDIGFGAVIKILLRFKNEWWTNIRGQDTSQLMFVLSNEKVTTWWTQYPERYPVITGWMGGPITEKYKNATDSDILELGLNSLANIFKMEKDFLKKELVHSRVINWPADPFARGAYSYTTIETKEAYLELIKPVNDIIFFAGEALYSGKETATVEGALASGKETAEKVLKIK